MKKILSITTLSSLFFLPILSISCGAEVKQPKTNQLSHKITKTDLNHFNEYKETIKTKILQLKPLLLKKPDAKMFVYNNENHYELYFGENKATLLSKIVVKDYEFTPLYNGKVGAVISPKNTINNILKLGTIENKKYQLDSEKTHYYAKAELSKHLKQALQNAVVETTVGAFFKYYSQKYLTNVVNNVHLTQDANIVEVLAAIKAYPKKPDVVKPPTKTLTDQELFTKYASDTKMVTVDPKAISKSSGNYPLSLDVSNKYFNFYGLTYLKVKKSQDAQYNSNAKVLRDTFNKAQKLEAVYYIIIAPTQNQKALIIAWVKIEGKVMLAQRFLKNKYQFLKFTENKAAWDYKIAPAVQSKYQDVLTAVKKALV